MTKSGMNEVALNLFIREFYMSHTNLLLRLRKLDLALSIINNLPNLDTTQMVLARNTRVVVEEVPLPLELGNGMVRRPALDRLQDAILVSERPQRRVTNRIRQVVRVAGRVREVVLAVVLVHPGGLEEAPVVVAGVDRLAVGVVDDQVLHIAGEGVHVVAQLRHARHQSGFVAGGFHVCVSIAVEFATSPALQLAAPDAAEVEVCLAVVVYEAGRVDAVAAGDVVLVGLEGAFGLVGDGDTDPEDAFPVSGREVEVKLAVLFGGIGSPELFVDPWDVLGFQCDAVVGDGAFDIGHGEDMVVGHVVLVAIVVVLDVGLTVVGWIDVELAVEDVGTWVGCEEVGHDGTGVFLRWVSHGWRCDDCEDLVRVSARDLHGGSGSEQVLYSHTAPLSREGSVY
jgi:hypothetical protein